jgi:hypothetical protein
MTEKTITIPLIHDRPLKMRFVKINEHQWQCLASEEYLTDIETFFKSGYYQLDPEKIIEVTTNV